MESPGGWLPTALQAGGCDLLITLPTATDCAHAPLVRAGNGDGAMCTGATPLVLGEVEHHQEPVHRREFNGRTHECGPGEAVRIQLDRLDLPEQQPLRVGASPNGGAA